MEIRLLGTKKLPVKTGSRTRDIVLWSDDRADPTLVYPLLSYRTFPYHRGRYALPRRVGVGGGLGACPEVPLSLPKC